jgi:hypothetical protein
MMVAPNCIHIITRNFREEDGSTEECLCREIGFFFDENLAAKQAKTLNDAKESDFLTTYGYTDKAAWLADQEDEIEAEDQWEKETQIYAVVTLRLNDEENTERLRQLFAQFQAERDHAAVIERAEAKGYHIPR